VVAEKGAAAVGAEMVVVKGVVIGAVKVAVDGGEVVAMVGKVVATVGLLP
jgi:hypothetical protein